MTAKEYFGLVASTHEKIDAIIASLPAGSIVVVLSAETVERAGWSSERRHVVRNASAANAAIDAVLRSVGLIVVGA